MAYVTIHVDGVRCDICGAEMIGDASTAGAAGWDWISGYTPPTKHACEACKGSSRWKEIVRASQTKPTPSTQTGGEE